MKDRFLTWLLAALVAIFLISLFNTGLDLSLSFSLIAIYLAVFELHRDNTTLVTIKHCDCSGRQSLDENKCEMFMQFKVGIQNRGVKLVDAFMTLEYVEPNGHGWTSMQLSEFSEVHGNHQHFERGMVAVFGWKSYKLDDNSKRHLGWLQDARKQKARLRVYSQSYLAQEFRIGNWWDRAKGHWNRLAFKVNYALRRSTVSTDGQPLLHVPMLLPTFVVLEDKVMEFIRKINRPHDTSQQAA